MSQAILETDIKYLKRCLELAEEALKAGDKPFGSILVSADGEILAEARNRVNEINELAHPEYELAQWAIRNLNLEERKTSTLYTSGEHCPMCAGAHAWADLGNIVYLSSASQLGEWLKEVGAQASPLNFIPIEKIVKGIEVRGPLVGDLNEQIKQLQWAYHQKADK